MASAQPKIKASVKASILDTMIHQIETSSQNALGDDYLVSVFLDDHPTGEYHVQYMISERHPRFANDANCYLAMLSTHEYNVFVEKIDEILSKRSQTSKV